MCNAISYVKVTEGGKTQIFWLEDKDIFSDYAQEKLAGCKDNDFLGHKAIRIFWGLGEKGIDKEVRDFWNTEKLPPELAGKVKDFDTYWGRTFQKCFPNDDLRYVIEYAPEAWKSRARNLLK